MYTRGGHRSPFHTPVASITPALVFSAAGRWTADVPACAVAVGNFDGVHVGHAEIVRRLLAAARRIDAPAVVYTFDPHPATIVRPTAAPQPLTTAARRAELLLALGVDAVLVQPTDRDLVALEAETFYRDILRGRLRAAALVEGVDFRFGAGRQGDVHLLEALTAADGVTLEIVQPVVVDGAAVSSSRLRSLIAAGDVRGANALATAAYRLTGTVVAGARRGGPLGFPTANLQSLATLLPGQGVYAGWGMVAGDRRRHPAAIHIGPNVSFGATAVSVEAHLIGFSGDLYGATLHVDFLDRLRDTRRFASLDELKTQLAVDVTRAETIAHAAAATERTP